MLRYLPFLLLLPACDLLNAATAEKPDGDQQRAIADTFIQVGTLAAIADDPSTAGNDDLATAMDFKHFAVLISPNVAKPLPAPRAGKPAPAPTCIAVNEDGTRVLSDCAVTLKDGRNCTVEGTILKQPRSPGNAYTGGLKMSGEGCPAAQVDFDVVLVGESNDPKKATGTVTFDIQDPQGADYSGHANLNDIAVTGKCTVPSDGTLVVGVSGYIDGKHVDGSIELSFHESPGCGVILIE